MARVARAGRCGKCGGKLRVATARAYGEVLPTAVVLLGSLLTFRLIGLLLLPLGAFLWTRRREIEVCHACGVSGRS